MGLLDLSAWAVAIVCPVLFGLGLTMVGPPHEEYRYARICFWLSAILLWGFSIVWGWKVNYSFPVRALGVTAISALAAIGLMQGLRITTSRERESKRVNEPVPAPIDPTPPTHSPGKTTAPDVSPSLPHQAKTSQHEPAKSAPKPVPDGPKTIRDLTPDELYAQAGDTAHALIQLDLDYQSKMQDIIFSQTLTRAASEEEKGASFKDRANKVSSLSEQTKAIYIERYRPVELSIKEEIGRRTFITSANKPIVCVNVERMDAMGTYMIGPQPLKDRAECLLQLAQLLKSSG
jgi:hypothetical protein